MPTKIFMLAKGFSLAGHYSALSAFISKKERVQKVKDLHTDRCLEFMTENDYSVEFVFNNDIIYARPSSGSKSDDQLEIIIRNITTHNQLGLIADLINGRNIVNLFKTLRELDKDLYKTYSLSNDKSISINTVVRNNGNTLIFDGEKI